MTEGLMVGRSNFISKINSKKRLGFVFLCFVFLFLVSFLFFLQPCPTLPQEVLRDSCNLLSEEVLISQALLGFALLPDFINSQLLGASISLKPHLTWFCIVVSVLFVAIFVTVDVVVDDDEEDNDDNDDDGGDGFFQEAGPHYAWRVGKPTYCTAGLPQTQRNPLALTSQMLRLQV